MRGFWLRLADTMLLVEFGVVGFGKASDMRGYVAQKRIAGLAVALQFNVEHFGHSFGFSALGLCVTGKLDGNFHF